ncbi:MAG: Stk1 family PASTA domain-containing Ser/Thr kinase [Cellulosilyticaceae bacterium]
MILTPGTILGERYEIIEKIGAGGMSIVYKAKCNRLQRFVAVKMLREEFVKDEEFVEKFKVEALSAARLSHPNIVGVYDVGNDHDLHYIVMEYMEGHTLKELIAREGPLEEKMVLEYGIQMLNAIGHAHKKQIIHRDIKPQNILVTQDKVLKVTDFGIARAVDSSTIVTTGNAIGSVHYFSPEQAKGKYVNETSDLYSCGIVLFELATKRLPFEADSHVSIALKHINEEIPHPSTFNPLMSKGLEQIILKATNKKQELRYQSAEEMIKDVKAVMANPNYVVKANIVSEEMGNTVLLTDLETSYIRENDRKENGEHVQMPPKPRKLDVEEVYGEDFEEEEEGEISSTYKILVGIGGILATLLLVGILGAVAFFFLPSWTATDAVIVPKVEGVMLEEAQSLAKDRGLTIKVSSEEASKQVPGTIIKQLPKADATIDKNGVIQVVVATAEVIAKVNVPDVVGMNNADAQRQLEIKDLTSYVDREYDENVEVGKVISQSPVSNTEVEKGEMITLVVSKGPKIIKANVPNLLGQTEAEANVSLANANLGMGRISEEYSATVEKGRIINQSISANNSVEEGTKIDIAISKGVEEVIPEEVVPEEIPETLPDESEQPGTEGEGQETEETEVTTTYTLNLPAGSDKPEYHVLVTFQTDQGVKSLFDEVIKHEDFPMSIQITGSGSGRLITYFDGQQEYEDNYSF